MILRELPTNRFDALPHRNIFIKSDWIKEDSVVIDAGYHPEKCGDIDLDQIEKKCSAYTPVPGGVGPMTINTLLKQTVEACEKSIQK